jgi:hypothetical protein
MPEPVSVLLPVTLNAPAIVTAPAPPSFVCTKRPRHRNDLLIGNHETAGGCDRTKPPPPIK